MSYAWYDLVGNLGVAALIVAYALLQAGRLSLRDPRYSVLNAIGAAFILVSLWFAFNLSAAIIESFWLVISLYGLRKARTEKNTALASTSTS
ncbi:MAG: hypothetical protein RhofKO_35640 [Rhodothermales bacterium]